MKLIGRWGVLLAAFIASPAVGAVVELPFTPVGVTHHGGYTYLVGNGSNGAFLATVQGNSLVTTTPLNGPNGIPATVTGISSNANYISGYAETPSSVGFGEGVVWSLQALSNPIPLGFLGTSNQSPAFDVYSNGFAVGDADGLRQPYRWSQTNGMESLPVNGIGGLFGVSDDGTVMVGATNNQFGVSAAAVWTSDGFSFLENPQSTLSLAIDISPNGQYIGGRIEHIDPVTFELIDQAAIWEDGSLTLLTDADGNRFGGVVLGIDSLGFAVGQTSSGLGFVFDPLVGHPELFADYALRTDLTVFPTTITSVNDVFTDGVDRYFALAGSGYLYSAPVEGATVPEPSTLVLYLGALATAGLFRRRYAQVAAG